MKLSCRTHTRAVPTFSEKLHTNEFYVRIPQKISSSLKYKFTYTVGTIRTTHWHFSKCIRWQNKKLCEMVCVVREQEFQPENRLKIQTRCAQRSEKRWIEIVCASNRAYLCVDITIIMITLDSIAKWILFWSVAGRMLNYSILNFERKRNENKNLI